MREYDDKDLYNACMNVCRTLTMLLFEKDKLYESYYIDAFEKEKIMDFHKQHLKHDFTHLYEVVRTINGDYHKKK